MPPSAPDVSVLTPSFGYARFIRDALRSVRLQEGLHTEHVVQDAGSTDGTVEILRHAGEAVRWRSEPDEGQSDALNRALGRASGRWIAWLNADEFYLPGGLRRLVEHGERTGADVVYGDAVLVDGDGALLRLAPQHGFSRLVLRRFGCYIFSCAVVFRRHRLADRPWDPGLPSAMDWDLFLRLAGEGARFAYVAYPVGAFRVHPDRVTAEPPSAFHAEWVRVMRRHGLRRIPGRPVGKLAHGALKAATGAYVRQGRARGLRGGSLRWFDPDVGAAAFDRLLSASYPGRGTRRPDGVGIPEAG